MGAGVVPPTLLVWPVLVHTFVGAGPCGPALPLHVHVCVLFCAVARFTSYLRPAWFNTPLWLPLFVILLACAAWHATYLRDSLLTRILSCVACLGAVVLPIQASVRGWGFFLLHSSLGWPWFTPLLSCSSDHTPLWCPLLVALPVCAAWHVTYLRGCNIPTSPTSFRVSCVAAPLYSLCNWACGGRGFASGSVVCNLLMPRTCSLLSYILPCCACYGVC